MFVGRQNELEQLQHILAQQRSALIVCRGRRRIGKSTLIQKFGKTAKHFYEFQGLAPRLNIGKQEQLASFSRQLSKQTSLPLLGLNDWSQAFQLLSSVILNELTVVLLDEISWMGTGDRDFAGRLKIAWDTEFKKKRCLILVLCGSVTSWIDRNILNSSGFVGRVSLEITLGELELHYCNSFWGKQSERISSAEKLRLLAVTGGVPRYLEEIDPTQSAEDNIKRMCFSKGGILLLEFNRIFKDIFSRRAHAYRQIISALVNGAKEQSEICRVLKIERSGYISNYLEDLKLSGFIRQDRVYKPAQVKPTRLSLYRLCDNYSRFYLKYIEPLQEKIKQGQYDDVPLEAIVNWNIIIGFQFENLVLNNIRSICKLLPLSMSVVKSASVYFQRKTNRQQACQIDLLIETAHTLYVCEIKFQKMIDRDIIDEVQEKIRRFTVGRDYSIRPVLIYEGKLAPGLVNEPYFDRMISFGEMLKHDFHYSRAKA